MKSKIIEFYVYDFNKKNFNFICSFLFFYFNHYDSSSIVFHHKKNPLVILFEYEVKRFSFHYHQFI